MWRLSVFCQRKPERKNAFVNCPTKNKCRTYFRISGDFDPDVITDILQIVPEVQWKAGDYRRNGTQYDFASWKFGTCSEYDVETENQMRKTIAPLFDKVELLQRIHSELDVAFSLVVVPELYVGETNPCLAPSMDIIDFCHETRTEIDIDMYLYGEDD